MALKKLLFPKRGHINHFHTYRKDNYPCYVQELLQTGCSLPLHSLFTRVGRCNKWINDILFSGSHNFSTGNKRHISSTMFERRDFSFFTNPSYPIILRWWDWRIQFNYYDNKRPPFKAFNMRS